MTYAIQSLLETDLYKFTMLQAFLRICPDAHGRYVFKCRNDVQIPWGDLLGTINEELDHLCQLQFKPDELEYLASLRYIKPSFVRFLKNYRMERDFIKAWVDDDGELHIEATGPLTDVMLFEIYVLATVNEIYFQEMISRHPEVDWQAIGNEKLDKKITAINEYCAQHTFESSFDIFDFGLRRRANRAWHEHVVKELKQRCPAVKGTSNVYLAKKFQLVPIGTNAHEYFQVHQAMDVRLRYFQKLALENWVQEYRGDLGIALTDVIGMDAFLNDFDLYFAKLFDGLRHDSGDPREWANKAINHYKSLKIEPKTKRLVFSDGLTVQSAIELHKEFQNKIQTAYGIGTSLSNDIGFKPLNIVMKIVECNDSPVAKLSDSKGKTMCEDPTFVQYLAQVFNKEI